MNTDTNTNTDYGIISRYFTGPACFSNREMLWPGSGDCRRLYTVQSLGVVEKASETAPQNGFSTHGSGTRIYLVLFWYIVTSAQLTFAKSPIAAGSPHRLPGNRAVSGRCRSEMSRCGEGPGGETTRAPQMFFSTQILINPFCLFTSVDILLLRVTLRPPNTEPRRCSVLL